jgi:alanyl-tRNA synthetase
MHWALRKVLGDTVRQKGSYVGPDRLRFDFAHLEAMKPDEVEAVERLVNERITEAANVLWTERAYSEVKGDPTVLQFFGDKYGETVRVVDIGGYSKELCGGTHVRNTKDIGTFRLLSESAIAAGVRRIEAVTGEALREHILQEFAKQDQRLTELKQKYHLTVSLIGIDSRSALDDLWNIKLERQQQLAGIEADLREKEKEAGKQKQADLQRKAAADVPLWIAEAAEINGTKAIVKNLGEIDAAFLQLAASELKKSFKGVAVLAGSSGGKAALLALVTEGKANAGQIIKEIAPIVGGKGGGKPDLAQGGGTDASKLDEALAKAATLI